MSNKSSQLPSNRFVSETFQKFHKIKLQNNYWNVREATLVIMLPVCINGTFNEMKQKIFELVERDRLKKIYFKAIASTLNDKGYRGDRGKKWTASILERFYDKRKKRLEWEREIYEKTHIRIFIEKIK